MILANGIKIEKSIFDTGKERDGKPDFLGGMLYFEVPTDCDLIILCGNSGGGYRPYRCLLPHQVYYKDLEKDFEENNFEAIYCLPVRSKDAILLAGKNDYAIKRWKK